MNEFEVLGDKIRRKDTYQEVDYEGFLRSTKSPVRAERIGRHKEVKEYETDSPKNNYA
jgi:hypothetical protein